MHFSHPKLPREAAEKLRIIPVHQMKPFVLMAAPVYVFMKRNSKFVALKAPLDFFTPQELEKLAPLESLFLPHSVDEAIPFRAAAKSVRSLLSWQPHAGFTDQGGLAISGQPLPPAPYELSDAILKIIGPLWSESKDPFLEPFFSAIFVSDLCDPLPSQLMMECREKNVEVFEKALLHSSWSVFLGLHLGYHQLDFLNQMRERVFRDVFLSEARPKSFVDALFGEDETDEIIALSYATLAGREWKPVHGKFFLERSERIAQKLASRIQRIASQMVSVPKSKAPTVFGTRGFIDV